MQLLLLVGEASILVVPLFDRQVLHAGAVIQLLLQIGQLQLQQGQFCAQLHLLGSADAVTDVEAGAYLLAALIGTAHVGLRPLRQGLQTGELAADGAEGFLGILHVGNDFGLAALQLGQTHACVLTLDLLGALVLGQGIEFGADVPELTWQRAEALGLALGLGMFLLDAVEQAEGVCQKLLVGLLADGEGLGLAEGIERPLYAGPLGHILRHGLRGAEADE